MLKSNFNILIFLNLLLIFYSFAALKYCMNGANSDHS